MIPKSKTCCFCNQKFAKEIRESLARFALRKHCRSESCTKELRRQNNLRRPTRKKRDTTLSFPYKTHPVIDTFLRGAA